MALSINQKGTIALGSVAGTTFTAKLQNAGSSGIYPEGTVFDCSAYKTETITGTVTIRRPGITFLFGEGDFTMSVPNQNMFDIQVPNVTIIGVSRSSRDSISTNGATRFIMTSTSGGYHIVSTPNASTAWSSSDSMTIMNIDLVGVKSTYTSSSGTPTFSIQGAGGIMINEGNPDVSGSNLNNVWINEVLIEGARRHGIMIYGGMASKIQNTRVRNAGGHGFYIAGSTTSMNLDTCYASGCYLAGFALHNTSYSTLNNCASDSNGLGYWMRNANAITMSSCGAEACEIRSSIPFNLGITLPSQVGAVTINDIGSDNVNYIKGSSFLFTGGSNITGTSCYSKDPGNRSGETTFASKFTAHIYAENGTEKVNMDNFLTAGDSPVKYMYRLGDVYNFTIDAFINTYDPLNPSESPDGAMTPIAEVLDAGGGNVFGDLSNAWSFAERRNIVVDPTANFRINQLEVEDRMSIPTYNAHPADPQSGTIYFNTTLNKLYIFSGSGWYDTCCATAPTPAPECVFPNGGIQNAGTIPPGFNSVNTTNYIKFNNKIYTYSCIVGSATPAFNVFDLANESYQILLTTEYLATYAGALNSVGIASRSFNTAYSNTQNSFYFTISTQGQTVEQDQYIGSNQFIIKYNLTTNEIDATYSLLNLNAGQAEDMYNIFNRSLLYIYDEKLFVVRKGYNTSLQPYETVVTRFTLDNLTPINSYTGDTGIPYNTELAVPCDLSINKNLLQYGSSVISSVQGKYVDPNGSYLIMTNLVDGSTSKFYYDNAAVTESVGYCISVTGSTVDNTFYIADGALQKIFEVAYNGMGIVNTFEFGYAGNVTDKLINSKKILFYSKNIQNSSATFQNYYAAHNVTDDVFLGQLVNGDSLSLDFITAFTWVPEMINGNPNDYVYIIYTMAGLNKLCAPYTV